MTRKLAKRGIVLSVLGMALMVGAAIVAWSDGVVSADPASAAHHSHAHWMSEVTHARAVHAAAARHARAEARQRATLARRAWLVAVTTPIAVCEEGGWIGYASPAFPDSLGLSAPAWYGYGGGSDLRPFVQAEVELRFTDAVLGGVLPDRVGCAAY